MQSIWALPEGIIIGGVAWLFPGPPISQTLQFLSKTAQEVSVFPVKLPRARQELTGQPKPLALGRETSVLPSRWVAVSQSPGCHPTAPTPTAFLNSSHLGSFGL